jgi:hypothetical protein
LRCDVRVKHVITSFALLLLVSCKESPSMSFGKPGGPFGPLAKLKFGEPDSVAAEKLPQLEF